MTDNGKNILSAEEINRYARHLTLAEVGISGQGRLKQARVLLIGAGGLGSPLGLYLAAAGVGHLGIVDFDEVDSSNLQRQVAHSTGDVGRLKVESMRDTLNGINPLISVEIHPFRLDASNAIDLFSKYDIVVDGSDNFATRYLVCDAAFFARKPLVYGSIFRFEGQITVFDTGAGGPCYRCLYQSPPPASLVPS